MTELRTSLPKINTTLPGPKAKELLKLREENVPVDAGLDIIEKAISKVSAKVL